MKQIEIKFEDFHCILRELSWMSVLVDTTDNVLEINKMQILNSYLMSITIKYLKMFYVYICANTDSATGCPDILYIAIKIPYTSPIQHNGLHAQ